MNSSLPVYVDEQRCKSCDICVSVCPAGVLSMESDRSKIIGKIAKVIFPQSCIGCKECEYHCPDFAIFVADKNDFKFAKITAEAKDRAEQIKSNSFCFDKTPKGASDGI